MSRHLPKPGLRQRGMTLIETMVALVIGMVLTLAVFAVMSAAEGSKRTMTSMNDSSQSGNIAMFVLDEWIRSAGSGFSQANFALGCPLHAAKAGAQLIPGTAALPEPFESVDPGDRTFRLAPLLIIPDGTTPAAGRTSDVLVLMSGTAGMSESYVDFIGPAAADALPLANTVGFAADDLVMSVDRQIAAGNAKLPCWIEQVSATSLNSLSLAGTWYDSDIGSAALTDLTIQSVALNLGNVANGNAPRFQLIGVGAHDGLFSYDLLNISGTALQQMSDGIFEMHALYGIDTDNDNRIDSWQAPSGDYAVSELMAGNQIAADRLRNIKAVRIGLLLRSRLTEKDAVAGRDTLTLFSDLGTALTFTRTLTEDEQKFRYRTMESTVPIRNTLLPVVGG